MSAAMMHAAIRVAFYRRSQTAATGLKNDDGHRTTLQGTKVQSPKSKVQRTAAAYVDYSRAT